MINKTNPKFKAKTKINFMDNETIKIHGIIL